MDVIKEKDKSILQKEQELSKLIEEYYSFDMSELKKEVNTLLNSESDKILQEKDNKLKDIANNFKRIMGLAQEHITKGSQFRVNELEEQQTIEEFEKQSEEYEQIVSQANQQKQTLRSEIANMEIQLRKLRDQVADKQIENKNLQYLIQKEEELKLHKNTLEKQALSALNQDLEDQLNVLQSNAEKITGKITPYGMEQVLSEKFKRATTAYQKFLEESQHDLKETADEVEKVRKELEKERIITQTLQHDVDINAKELQTLQETFQKHKGDLDEMNFQHDQKLKELEQIRIRANEEIKRLSLELGTAQSEINVLILESQKYESQLEFLAAEREMILKAQLESENIDPYFQTVDLQEAEAKRLKIEEEINKLNQEWFGKLEKIKDETERVLSENEMKEFRSRIAILAAELNQKNSQIENINKDKQDLEKVAEKSMSLGMQISTQTEEIAELNEKYKAALREKVDVYDELIESLKELVNRNARYMKNEVEMCKLINETAIIKRELEQKEKYVEELQKDIDKQSSNDKELQAKIQDRIESKTEMLRKLRQEIKERDQEIEFFEFLLKEKQRNINEMQSSLMDSGSQSTQQQMVQKKSSDNIQTKNVSVSLAAKKGSIDLLSDNKKKISERKKSESSEERKQVAQTKKITITSSSVANQKKPSPNRK